MRKTKQYIIVDADDEDEFPLDVGNYYELAERGWGKYQTIVSAFNHNNRLQRKYKVICVTEGNNDE